MGLITLSIRYGYALLYIHTTPNTKRNHMSGQTPQILIKCLSATVRNLGKRPLFASGGQWRYMYDLGQLANSSAKNY